MSENNNETYYKKWYDKNKDELKEKMKEKTICGCMGKYTKSNEKTHKSSKRHLLYEMNKIAETPLIDNSENIITITPHSNILDISQNNIILDNDIYDEVESQKLASTFLLTLQNNENKNIDMDEKTLDILNDYMKLGHLQNIINKKIKDLLT